MIGPRGETLYGWGGTNHARSLVYRPRDTAEVREALKDARQRGLTVAHRGSGQSYGDAALNQGGAVIKTTGMDRILEYDPARGTIEAEAGVTIDQLWRHVIVDGWWPPVVPGTSRPTLGGCLAMNIHGKNHVQAGSFGEHVRAVRLLSPNGEVENLEPGDPGFEKTVGTQGLSGTILSLELDLTRVASGYLHVEAHTAPNVERAMAALEALESRNDYTVGWLDCFASDGDIGRAELHAASYVTESREGAGDGLSVESQTPSPRMFGVVPRRYVPLLLRLAVNDPGMQTLNALKYAHARAAHPSSYLQTHASFHFLLDYIPDWKRAYGPGGLLQYQFFVPKPEAAEVFTEALRRQHVRGIVSYLGVLKRHRSDPFPSNYSVDGYSLALDFPVRTKRLPDLMGLLADFDAMQREAGGRVYAAKDSVSQLGKVPHHSSRATFSSNLVRRWRRTRERRMCRPAALTDNG